jgi:hypothetical protein
MPRLANTEATSFAMFGAGIDRPDGGVQFHFNADPQ